MRPSEQRNLKDEAGRSVVAEKTTQLHLVVLWQTRTVWSQEVVTYVDFSGLAPGQNYCAVANFSFPTFSMAASAKSDPQCVETVYNLGPAEKNKLDNAQKIDTCLREI